ncbi:hypothetical protein [Glutamicibacter sp. NPDC090743]|uniref:hypothetical protein n=1 Tax=Glutamicibacter sp. NPDC090743 TaxID=3364001 RepID=UPI00380982F7
MLALASAKQAAKRMEERIAKVEDKLTQQELDARVVRLVEAWERVSIRMQQAIPERNQTKKEGTHEGLNPVKAPHPTAAPTITEERIDSMSWDEVAEFASTLGDDPEAAEKLEELVDRREARELGEVEVDLDEPDQRLTPVMGEDPVLNPAARAYRKLTPHERAREEYETYVYSQYQNCVSELSFLVNKEGQAKNIDEMSLFTGPISRVKKYASEELQAWFARNGRQTLGSYRYAMYQWDSDADAARRVRLEGFDNVAQV